MSSTNDNNEIAALLAGIPQSANALGQPAAPVTLAYFADLQCPYCRDFSLEVLPSIVERWARAGKLRIEFHALQTATHESAVFLAQQVAALAAGGQERAWHFIETFYAEQGEENSGYVTDAYLQGIASQVTGLDLVRWASDRRDPELANEIAGDARTAENAGLSGTPSFLIGASGGAMSGFSPSDSASFDAAIEELLKSAPMSIAENKLLMQQIFRELAKGNSEPFRDAMADDFSWTVIGTSEWSGTYAGKQAVLSELISPLFSQFADRYTNTADRFIAEGDHVVVQCRGHVTTKSGMPYNNTYCYVCRLSDGKLLELTEYCDTQLIATALASPDVRA